ncbi:hypothetical protein BCT46_09145 [Vibrio sp. 10N.261.46.E8]|nr:hypothetical protein BH584_14920 [Vibrio sp. 10N.261.45.E1]PMJ36938.1 hypothetical protein BCU27_22425 [Vibrio sp. 10N.286.45.B6]PML91704.1 hypothetical protein BCT66_04090 [Vibrio sp. 10N.261.49.E11]PMM66501.1 hypothetical protein BCT48_17145 [Vibrio sp. 10N.261.46.F12]PMM85548.1 hypothetical protein BCT46_09145 [Vibrio sp. 10N.261.46.E8]PMN39310.1 hypothetical protein BCT34_03465 [Vibrio sp. 10N.261.45.E2]PMN59237.1 hypothetical protein BCT32_22095 [Vibrio sp. 10N.261.45.E11]PMN82781.1 
MPALHESADDIVDFELGSVVVIFPRRPKNHQCDRFDDGCFRVQWFAIIALDNEVCGAAFKEQKALTESFVGEAI